MKSDLISNLPNLSALYRGLSQGHHLSITSSPDLWGELKREEPTYRSLFAALGYELHIDARDYAWFEVDQTSPQKKERSKHLALFFMYLFDDKNNVGALLPRFDTWRIDNAYLLQIYEKNKDVWHAEGLAPEDMLTLIRRAEKLGFARQLDNEWQLLPPVYRYLDYYKTTSADQMDADPSLTDNDPVDEAEEFDND